MFHILVFALRKYTIQNTHCAYTYIISDRSNEAIELLLSVNNNSNINNDNHM